MPKVIKFTSKNPRQITAIELVLLKNSILIDPCLIFNFNNGNPNPIKRLNKGPAIEPDKAISPYPNLTKLKFSIKSDTLFPYVNIVIPKNESGIFIKVAIAINKAIKIFAVNHIQIKDIINEKIHMIIGHFGISYFEVKQ